MTEDAVTARACANIAFVKYWGNRDSALRIPLNDSVSMNLSHAVTTTTVRFDRDLVADTVTIDGEPRLGSVRDRVARHLDVVRGLADTELRATVVSHNSFPMGTGIASSASGFAALSLAASRAAGLILDEAALSRLARRGSGSAARSVPGGFVEWKAGRDDESSVAQSLAPARHWDLRDLVAVVSREPKTVGSSDGHAAALASPLIDARVAAATERLEVIRSALLDRDLAALGPVVEIEALCMHAVAMTGTPSLLYWCAGTMEVLHAVRRWRADGLGCYFTLDAGPNPHVLCAGVDADDVRARLDALAAVTEVLENRPGGAASVVDAAP